MTCSGEPRLMPELEASSRNEISSSCVLGHVMWILVPHIDNGGADFDLFRSHPDRRGKLPREVVDPEICAVHADALSLDGEVDGLQKHVSS